LPAAERAAGAASPTGAIDLALRLTLLDLLLRPVGSWVLRPFILGLAVVGLLRSGWLRHPSFWLALAALTGLRVVLDWPLADNHAYLLSYWCLAIGLALMTQRPAPVLADSARLLIALVFIFASLWKFWLSDHYADGSFFEVTFLTDPRFEGFARVAGGLDAATYAELSGHVEQHQDAPPPSEASAPAVPARYAALAGTATAWNLFINAALAVVFAWPGRSRPLLTARHGLLLAYCAITYAVATVEGFGWLLLAMGVSQCRPDQRRLRYAYVAVFVLIIAYREVPWADELWLPLIE
jgi:hypothetical protein